MERDLLGLLEDYKEIKREIRVYDKDDIISSVKVFLHDGGSPSFMAGSDVIVFDGFVNISRIEEDILFHLFSLVGEVWWLYRFLLRSGKSDQGVQEVIRKTGGRIYLMISGSKATRSGVREACRIFGSFVSLMDRLEEAGINISWKRLRIRNFLILSRAASIGTGKWRRPVMKISR